MLRRMTRVGNKTGGYYHRRQEGDEAESESGGLDGSDRDDIQVIHRMFSIEENRNIFGDSG